MTRYNYNLKILDILKDKIPYSFIYKDLLKLIQSFKKQRFGQIICNYVCSDYRDSEKSVNTTYIMENLFPIDFDPFFEESEETYKRLTKINN